jgi:hypothetical protein
MDKKTLNYITLGVAAAAAFNIGTNIISQQNMLYILLGLIAYHIFVMKS